MDKEKFVNLELYGLIFTFIIGFILKCSIGIFGINLWTILISSINTSAWETTKVFAFAYLIWTCLEYCMIKVPMREFIVSKVIGMYAILVTGIFLFWIMSCIMGISNFFIDTILLFIIVAFGYAVSYKVILADVKLNDWFVLSLFCIALFFAMYFCFLVSPPHFAPFIDKSTYSYGIHSFFDS